MNANRTGWVVIARDGDNDEFPRRFAVHIANVDAAVMAIARIVPEQACLPERALSLQELREMKINTGEYKQL
jgi:hypothetical protein